jgi:hypothetical protein
VAVPISPSNHIQSPLACFEVQHEYESIKTRAIHDANQKQPIVQASFCWDGRRDKTIREPQQSWLHSLYNVMFFVTIQKSKASGGREITLATRLSDRKLVLLWISIHYLSCFRVKFDNSFQCREKPGFSNSAMTSICNRELSRIDEGRRTSQVCPMKEIVSGNWLKWELQFEIEFEFVSESDLPCNHFQRVKSSLQSWQNSWMISKQSTKQTQEKCRVKVFILSPIQICQIIESYLHPATFRKP